MTPVSVIENQSLLAKNRPYPPSWFDVLKQRVEALPGPWWLAYALVALIFLFIQFFLSLQSGIVLDELSQIYFFLIATGSAYVLATTHFLDRAALSILQEFRPALGTDDSKYQLLLYQLTTMPARLTLAFSGAGVLFVTIALLRGFVPFQLLHSNAQPLWQWFNGFTEILFWFINGMFIFHTFRQLYRVKEIYDKDAQINLFKLGPLYALSGLPARTAIGILLIGYGATFTGSQIAAPLARLVSFSAASLGIFLCFLIPLLGIHHRLAQEKERLLDEITTRIESTIAQVHADMDAGNLERVVTQKALSETLELQLRVVGKIPTWPWKPETISVVITALILPIVLFVIQFIIQRMIAP